MGSARVLGSLPDGRFCPKTAVNCVDCAGQIWISVCLLRANASVHNILSAPGAPNVRLLESQAIFAEGRSCPKSEATRIDSSSQIRMFFVFAQSAGLSACYQRPSEVWSDTQHQKKK